MACSVGFSGRTTAQILGEYRGAKEAEILKALGGRADVAIALTGVNDQVQHIGARRRAADVAALAARLRSDSRRVLIVADPYISPVDASWLGAQLKHDAARYLNDGGARSVTASYRNAVMATGVEMVPFDPFIGSYAKNRACYAGDGIHLTPSCFTRYGAYLGTWIGDHRSGRAQAALALR